MIEYDERDLHVKKTYNKGLVELFGKKKQFFSMSKNGGTAISSTRQNFETMKRFKFDLSEKLSYFPLNYFQ